MNCTFYLVAITNSSNNGNVTSEAVTIEHHQLSWNVTVYELIGGMAAILVFIGIIIGLATYIRVLKRSDACLTNYQTVLCQFVLVQQELQLNTKNICHTLALRLMFIKLYLLRGLPFKYSGFVDSRLA